MFHYMAGWATRLNGETIQVSSPGNWHAYILREPVRRCGGVRSSCGNFPPHDGGVEAGLRWLHVYCTIVLLKLNEKVTPLTALRLGELVQEAGVPDGVVNIVTGFGENGLPLRSPSILTWIK